MTIKHTGSIMIQSSCLPLFITGFQILGKERELYEPYKHVALESIKSSIVDEKQSR